MMREIEKHEKHEHRKYQLPYPAGLHGLFACFPVLHDRNVANDLLAGAGAPIVKGAAHLLGWNQVETGPDVFDWTLPDAHVNEWANAGKPSVLLWAPTSYSVPDIYLPGWYAGPTIDTDTNPTCGSGKIPVYWDPYFETHWQQFLTAAVEHYAGNASVIAMRPGFGIGFENYAARNASPNSKAACGGLLAGAGYSTAVWIDYLTAQIVYMASLAPSLFQWSLNYTSYGVTDPANVQALAATAVARGLTMLVSAGLQQGDKTSTSGSNDWLEVLQQQRGKAAVGLQTVGLSDPTGTAPAGSNSALCGSLLSILPWSVQTGAQYLEIYSNDLLAAFCPANTNPGYQAAQDQDYPSTFAQVAGLIN